MNNKPIKILAFMNAFSQGRSGSDMVFAEVASRLNDFEFSVVTSFLGKDLCKNVGVKAKFHLTTGEQSFNNVFLTYFKRIIMGAYYSLKLPSHEIVWATSDFLPDVVPAMLNKFFKKSIYVQHIYHIIRKERPVPYYFQKLSFLFIKTFADKIIIDNNLLKTELEQLGFDSSKLEINYPGIHIDYLETIERGDRGYDGIFMAQLRESKGIFDLVEIWKLVLQEKPMARLGIIGKGNEEDTRVLKKMISEENLIESIDLLGFLPNDEAFSTIKASKVCVFPSHEEGFGIVPLECQLLGLPVVAWNLPVFEEIFPKGMIKVERNNFTEFSRTILKLFDDDKYFQLISTEARKNARRFSWDDTAKREVRIFKQLTK